MVRSMLGVPARVWGVGARVLFASRVTKGLACWA